MLDGSNHIFSAEHKWLMHNYLKDLAEKGDAENLGELSWQLSCKSIIVRVFLTLIVRKPLMTTKVFLCLIPVLRRRLL